MRKTCLLSQINYDLNLLLMKIRGRRVRVELASGMSDSRNAFQRGSRMGMDFGSSSDEPGDWRSSIRSSTNTDDRGGIL